METNSLGGIKYGGRSYEKGLCQLITEMVKLSDSSFREDVAQMKLRRTYNLGKGG